MFGLAEQVRGPPLFHDPATMHVAVGDDAEFELADLRRADRAAGLVFGEARRDRSRWR